MDRREREGRIITIVTIGWRGGKEKGAEHSLNTEEIAAHTRKESNSS